MNQRLITIMCVNHLCDWKLCLIGCLNISIIKGIWLLINTRSCPTSRAFLLCFLCCNRSTLQGIYRKLEHLNSCLRHAVQTSILHSWHCIYSPSVKSIAAHSYGRINMYSQEYLCSNTSFSSDTIALWSPSAGPKATQEAS